MPQPFALTYSLALNNEPAEAPVKHSELVESVAIETERQELLAGGEMAATTICAPKKLEGTSLSSYARMHFIDNLANKE